MPTADEIAAMCERIYPFASGFRGMDSLDIASRVKVVELAIQAKQADALEALVLNSHIYMAAKGL